MLPDPKSSLSESEKAVFGSDARRHPVTGFPLEMGVGAVAAVQQAQAHLQVIYETEGPADAEAMRIKLMGARPRAAEKNQ